MPATSFPNRHSLRFDGKDDYVEVDPAPGVWVKGAFCAWIKTTNATEVMYLTGTANPTAVRTRFACSIDGRQRTEDGYSRRVGEVRLYLRDEKCRQFHRLLRRPTGVCDGRWHHVAITWNLDHQNLQIYVDGVARQVIQRHEGPRGAPHEFAPFEFPLSIGACNSSGNVGGFFEGLLDDLRLYDRPLSREEIKALAARGERTGQTEPD